MVWQTPLLSVVSRGMLDRTADFALLFVGRVVASGLGVLALACTIGVHDTPEAKRTARQVTVPQPSLPKAA